eukprot:758347-Hanusia_phi.AAC.2
MARLRIVTCPLEIRLTPIQSGSLHMAVLENHAEIVKVLILNEADVNCKDDEGFTPLHYAAVMGHENICALLLSCGADVKKRNHEKETPLDVAKKDGKKEIVTGRVEPSGG